MKEIYVVYTGCYSDVCEHGYFTEEDKAKEYCEFMNQVCDNSWNKYRYYELKPVDLQKPQGKSVSLFTVSTDGWDIINIEGQIVNCEETEHLCHYCTDYSGFASDDKSILENDFDLRLVFIGFDDKERVFKAAQDLIAIIKKKYYECNDWELTMSCFGGEVR